MGALSAIDVTPLIDLAFSLLIIFMISTPLLEQSIQVDLPRESPKPQTSRAEQRLQSITIDNQGTLYWGDAAVSRSQLDDLLASAANEAEQPVITLRADRTISYQEVVSVIDLIKQHNLTKLNLETRAQ